MSTANSASKLAFETERTLAAASIIAGYSLMGSLFTDPIRILVLQNQTDAAVTFSLDGVRDTITLQSKTMFSIDICTNRTEQSGVFTASKNSGVWVKQSGVPTTGSAYVSAFYAAE